jgi:predicted RNase H-like HicB family nuclease
MRILRYPIIIEKTARNYSAFSPDLPGCVATGRTLEQTIKTWSELYDCTFKDCERTACQSPNHRASSLMKSTATNCSQELR